MSADGTRIRVVVRTAALAALIPAFGACDWFTDFKNQPKIEPWEPMSQLENDTTHPPYKNPLLSIPVSGRFVAGYRVSYNPLPQTIDSIAAIVENPTPPSEASLLNGRKQFQINCAVCHGNAALGNGPATLYGMPGISLVNARVRGLRDGYIYGMMRNGRGAMPSYNRIEDMDRWDVVNYIRALEGVIPNTAGTGPVGYPGQNGATVPSYSATAPTLPPPMWRAPRGPAGGMVRQAVGTGIAGYTRSPAMVLGQLGEPVPLGTANDSGPAPFQNRDRAISRPLPQTPTAIMAVPTGGAATLQGQAQQIAPPVDGLKGSSRPPRAIPERVPRNVPQNTTPRTGTVPAGTLPNSALPNGARP